MDTFTAQIPDTDNLAAMPELLVNGVAFIELVRRHELPFAMAEGKPDLAGDYFVTGAAAYYPTGHPSSDRYDGEEKSMLLGCAECGFVECWPLLARVETQGETVIWSDFEQPHRRFSGVDGAPAWSYKDFGPFVFERVSYIAEVDKYLAREDARLHSTGSRRLTYDERMELTERIMSDDDWDE